VGNRSRPGPGSIANLRVHVVKKVVVMSSTIWIFATPVAPRGSLRRRQLLLLRMLLLLRRPPPRASSAVILRMGAAAVQIQVQMQMQTQTQILVLVQM